MAKFSRKVSASSNFLLFVLIMAGFFALINYFSSRHFARLDLTENKAYSLSEASKKIVLELDDIVTIKCYFSRNLPSYVLNIKQRLQDMLEEYKAYAKGKIQVEFLDPAENPEVERKMQFIGIPQVQMNIVEKDQATATKIYMGVAIAYEDQQEVIPFLRDTDNLEYDLTSSILKVTRKEKKIIGFLAGHGEHDINDDYQALRSALVKQYETEKVVTSEGKPIADTIDVLVIAGPDGLTDRDKYEIDQYIMKGGKVFFLVDVVTIPPGTIQATYRQSNIGDLLENYGVKLTRDLVLDRMNMYITFQTGYTIVRAPYPFFVKVVEAGFDPDNAIVNQLESLVFPWVGALEILPDTHANLDITVLAKSSPYSWVQKGMYDINPSQEYSPFSEEDVKQYDLAVWVQGKFKSFYADRDIPRVEESQSEEGDPEQKEDENRETIKECSEDTQILVVANSRFLEDNFINNLGNLEFILNALDWSTWGKELIGIRSRKVTDRSLPILTEHQKTLIRFANMLAVPILVTFFGFVRFYIKRKRKTTLKDISA